MDKTLLAIGDEKDWDSYLKFRRQGRLLKKYGFDFAAVDYDAVLNDDCPPIASETLVVFLFFPVAYWDRHIEPKRYPGLYGSRRFYSKLRTFWKLVGRALRQQYGDKDLHFVNSPENVPTERDKEATKRVLARAGIATPRAYRTRDLRAILALLRKGRKLFIKVRYGSMGKGITYLKEGCWRTNFGFREGRILNRHSDYGWRFRDVTGNRRFLRQLLKEDVMVEQAVEPWLIGDSQFDLRLLIFCGRILYMYPRSNDVEKVTTNVSQGARSRTMAFLDGVSRGLIRKVERTGVKAVKALGLNFAGVDIMLDPLRRVPVVIEVNGFPGFPKVRTFNLAKHLIPEIGERRWK